VRKTRKRELNAIGMLIFEVAPHTGAWTRRGYSPSKQRQLRKAFQRWRRRGNRARLAMTAAVLEVGNYA
jgi:hypothetical protein